MDSQKPILEAQRLVKSFAGRGNVVDGVSINVHPGEIVGILGKNGAGKSTTFKMICGLLQPNSGQVFFDGQDITHYPMYRRARLGMGYLDQKSSVFSDLTAEDNVEAVLEAIGISRKERRERTNRVMEQFGIAHVRKSKAGALSGGERRRLEISRVMAIQPKLIMLDEPFAAIDPIACADLAKIIVSLKELNIAILITDHDAVQTLNTTDRSYIFSDPDSESKGHIICDGTSQELVENPIARDNYLGQDFKL